MKGFVYTFFVLFVTSLLIILLVFPLNLAPYRDRGKKIRTDEASYFLKSIQSDLVRAYDISTKRASVAVINEIIDSGVSINSPKSFLEELIHEGTFNSTDSIVMENSAITDWISKIEGLSLSSDYLFSMNNLILELEETTFPFIRVNCTENISLEDPKSGSTFHEFFSIVKNVNISGIEDPLYFLRTNGKKTRAFKQCDNSFRASNIGSGSQYIYSDSNWTYGTSALFLNNEDVSLTQSKGSKIAFVNDLCEYNASQIPYLETFKGIVSETSVDLGNPCGTSISLDNFVGNVQDLNKTVLKDNLTIVLTSNEVWINNILDEVQNSCYFYTSRGPSFFERMGNKLICTNCVGGVGSFLKINDLPTELQKTSSSLDYVYWNESAYGALNRIKGVTNELSWFRLDQFHVNLWNVESLTY